MKSIPLGRVSAPTQSVAGDSFKSSVRASQPTRGSGWQATHRFMDPKKRRGLLGKSDGASVIISPLPIQDGIFADGRPVTNEPLASGSRTLRRETSEEGYKPLEQSDTPDQSRDNSRDMADGLVRRSAAKTWYQVQREELGHIFCHPVNIMLIFAPICFACKAFHINSGIVFCCSCLALLPLAQILGETTEALSVHTGQVAGGLLNATFGNAVEMILMVQAVKAGLLAVVRDNMLGSILSNLLLILGMAVVASGVARHDTSFNSQSAAANLTCQMVGSISICLPSVFNFLGSFDADIIVSVSRICSISLMIMYALFLVFMLKTHADMFEDHGADELDIDDHHLHEGLSPTISASLLIVSTLLVVACSESIVSSIEHVSRTYGLSKSFIGTILLPIVGNACEHTTAIRCAYKGMMDLAISVAVGSSTQIVLFVVPCAVICGWTFDQPMTLAFEKYQLLWLMLSVFLVSQVLELGHTNWLHGSMLITVYLFIATMCCYVRDVV